MNDSALLRQFVDERSESALAGLVGRHVDLVYSAANRQLKDATLAEDVTQSVFILLAEKASTIRDGEALAGWLLVTTRFVALNTIRAEARRRRHEHEAAAMRRDMQSDVQSADAPRWESIGPLLDDAVSRLKRKDRDALAMRYFQGRSVAEVATSMGISQEAAQKRVSRAVDRLRSWFAERGITTSAEGLTSALTSNAVSAAPALLGAKISTAAISKLAAGGSSIALGKGTVTLMAAAKTKLVAAGVAAALLVGVTGTIAYQQLSGPSSKPRQVAVPVSADASQLALAPSSGPAPTNWMAQFHNVYDLKDGEVLKRVPPPFAADRLLYYRTYIDTNPASQAPLGPDVIVFRYDRNNLSWHNAMSSGGHGGSVQYALDAVGKIASRDMQIPNRMLARPLPGDWVVRQGASETDVLAALSAVISSATNDHGSLIQKPIERDAIVVSGKLALKPLPEAQTRTEPTGPNPVYLFRGDLKKVRHINGGTGGINQLLDQLGAQLNRPIVNEITSQNDMPISWQDCLSGNDTGAIAEILANMSKQTSLQFTLEKRVVPTWVWEKSTP